MIILFDESILPIIIGTADVVSVIRVVIVDIHAFAMNMSFLILTT